MSLLESYTIAWSLREEGDENGLFGVPLLTPLSVLCPWVRLRGKPLGTGFPRTPFETLLPEFLRNSDFNWWDFGWEYVSHCLERILLTLWDRGVKVWRRGFFPFSRITEKRRGGSGGEIRLAPGVASAVRISICHPLHAPIGGGVRKNHELGEGAGAPSRGSGAERITR